MTHTITVVTEYLAGISCYSTTIARVNYRELTRNEEACHARHVQYYSGNFCTAQAFMDSSVVVKIRTTKNFNIYSTLSVLHLSVCISYCSKVQRVSHVYMAGLALLPKQLCTCIARAHATAIECIYSMEVIFQAQKHI